MDEWLSDVLEAFPDAVVFANERGVVIGLNRRAGKLFGCTYTELVGQNIETLLPGAFQGVGEEHFKLSSKQKPFHLDEVHYGVKKNGEKFFANASLNCVQIKNQFTLCYTIKNGDTMSSHEGIENKFRDIIDFMPDAILIMDDAGKIVLANKQTEAIFGYKSHELIGQAVEVLIPRRYQKKHVQHRLNYNEHAVARSMGSGMELFGLRKNGSEFPVEVSLSPIAMDQKNFICSVIRDVSERQQKDQQIELLEHYDVTTKLSNWIFFQQASYETFLEAQQGKVDIALFYLDLDYFKKINDLLGHEAGDEVLSEAAARLEGLRRPSDFIARLSGDEFVLLVKGWENVEELRDIAEKIVMEFNEPFLLDGRQIKCTMSIGITTYSLKADDMKSLIRKANFAMYKAKQKGRNCFHYFTEQINREMRRQLELEDLLLSAVEKNEFSLVFQPVIDVSQNKIVGAEALLRWNNSVFGNVEPAEFIPIAERINIIDDITSWVLSQAAKYYCEWVDCDVGRADLSLYVNISALQMQKGRAKGLIDDIKFIRQKRKIPLILEVTETSLIENFRDVAENFDQLHKQGIKIAIDDFGSGYASLSYLRLLPIEILKIDLEFIRDVTVNPNDAVIVKAIIELGRILNIKVIAEGVETEAQLQFLLENGCSHLQGFYFCRPLPPDKFFDFLTSWSS